MRTFRAVSMQTTALIAGLLVLSCNQGEYSASTNPQAANPQTFTGASTIPTSYNLDLPLMSQQALQHVIQAQNLHTTELLAHRHVVGTGSGVDEQGRPSIVVLVENTDVNDLPKQLEGLPVTVVVSGRINALAGAPSSCAVTRTAKFARPVPIGISTGHPLITAGTIGARVKNSAGQLFALSNNHVYAAINSALIGDRVLQPGTYDGGKNPADSIGRLSAFEPIKFCDAAGNCPSNTIDAAIASTTTALVGNATPCDGYGTPKKTTVAATVGLKVQKYGRTTGLTSGQISAINVSVKVSYGTDASGNALTALFTGQVYIQKGGFSDGGDSGSLIVSSTGNPVALLFAGSTNSTIGNPISSVLSRFGVTIDGT
jgi:hypothetical protein